MTGQTIREDALKFIVELAQFCDTVSGKAVFINQILRSASSIGANAYEANYAQSTADFINKLEISLKECYETEYWLEVLHRTGTMSDSEYKQFAEQCGSIRRKLISAITNTKKS